MWNAALFKDILEGIVKKGEFKGEKVKCLEDIRRILAKEIFKSFWTVKRWSYSNSDGPSSEEDRILLEKALGLPEGTLITNNTKERENIMQNFTLTDFNKKAIFRCYELMKDYLHDDDMEKEDCLVKMDMEIRKQRIAMPDQVYAKIEQFVKENLDPIIYEHKEVYAECYKEDNGFFDEEDKFVPKDKEAEYRILMAFILKNIEIERKLDEFAMEELHPLLV